MGSKADKTFVGFGFGPIQSALFARQAVASGMFRRVVVAEIDPEIVRPIQAAGGRYTVNFVRGGKVEALSVDGLEIYDTRDPEGRKAVVEAVAASDELATAVPSVDSYAYGDPTCVASVIADGLARRTSPRPTVIYTAENDNHAAEILRARLADFSKGPVPPGAEPLNTVIGMVAGATADRRAAGRAGPAPMTPATSRTIVAGEYDRTLISRIADPAYTRGLTELEAKEDLLPFEEAKLYGVNAVHALMAYLADASGLTSLAAAGRREQIMSAARGAFVGECLPGVTARYGRLGDARFTPDGYRQYAERFLARIVDPHLNDQVSRVGRDPVRKLAKADRLYGAMGMALDCGVRPRRLAMGAAAGVVWMIRRREELTAAPHSLPPTTAELDMPALRALLLKIWGPRTDRRAEEMISLTWEAMAELRREGYTC